METRKACSEESFILNRKTGIVHRPDCRTLPRLPWLPYGTTWTKTESIGNMKPCRHCLPRLTQGSLNKGTAEIVGK